MTKIFHRTNWSINKLNSRHFRPSKRSDSSNFHYCDDKRQENSNQFGFFVINLIFAISFDISQAHISHKILVALLNKCGI